MDKDEMNPANINADVRKAELQARKREDAKVAAEAWAEHLGHDAARDEKTAGLKAQRMARDAQAPVAPKPKPRKKAMARSKQR